MVKRHVPKALDASWESELSNAITSPSELPARLAERVAGSFDERRMFPLRITRYYLSLADLAAPHDPILRQCIPERAELFCPPGLCHDPIAEAAHSPLPGLVRRYPDRAAVLLSSACAVNCRHCTRRQLGSGNVTAANKNELKDIVAYLRENAEISDVLVTGGDPLLLQDDALVDALRQLRSVPSVQVLRIGTRAPVTLPMRVTETLVSKLRRFSPLFVVTQFNHPRELTALSRAAVARFVDAGIPVANQSVLLRGVNDDPLVMEALCRSLLGNRVLPYYLFLCDQWPGLEHLRTTFDEGLAIAEHLRGRLSGLAIPRLVVDLPGGFGKVPVGPSYIVRREPGKVVLRGPTGVEVDYLDPVDSPY